MNGKEEGETPSLLSTNNFVCLHYYIFFYLITTRVFNLSTKLNVISNNKISETHKNYHKNRKYFKVLKSLGGLLHPPPLNTFFPQNFERTY